MNRGSICSWGTGTPCIEVVLVWFLLVSVFPLVSKASNHFWQSGPDGSSVFVVSVQQGLLPESTEPEVVQLRRGLLEYRNSELSNLPSGILLLEGLLSRADQLGDTELVYELLGELNRLLGFVPDAHKSLEILHDIQARYQFRWPPMYAGNVKLREIHLWLDPAFMRELEKARSEKLRYLLIRAGADTTRVHVVYEGSDEWRQHIAPWIEEGNPEQTIVIAIE